MHGIFADLRFAMRQLHVAPGWSLTVIAVLGLGIGLALATFMLVDALLFRPLGIPEQERVVRIGATREHLGSSSYPAYLEYRDRSDAFTGVAASTGREFHWKQPDGSRVRVAAQLVSGNWFETLGLVPMPGRAMAPTDDVAGAARVVVVSDRFWRQHLGGRSDAVGRTMTLDNWNVTVIGVMPAAFRGLRIGPGADLWLPLTTANTNDMTGWSWHWLDVVARLEPGIDLAQADAQIDAIAAARDPKLIDGTTEQRARAVPVFPLRFGYGAREANQAAWLLLGGAALILLTACANATGLLLVRAERRRGELAVRASLGAANGRLARQLFVETSVLAGVGGVLGVFIGQLLAGAALRYGATESILSASAETLPTLWRASWTTAGLATLAALLAGTLPALKPSRLMLAADLKMGGTGAVGTTRRWRIGRWLVVAQFALTVVLVVGSGLMLRSLVELWSSPLGARASEAVVLPLEYSSEGFGRAGADARNRLVLDSLEGVPGVAAAGIGSMVPIDSSNMETNITLAGRTDGRTDAVQAFYNPVSAHYFEGLSTRLVSGRSFRPDEGKAAPPVAIVSRALAQRYFAGMNAVGQRVSLSPDTPAAEIVGVVEDMKYMEVAEPWRDVVYVPLEQRIFGEMFSVVVRPQPGAESAARAALAAAWRKVEPERAMPMPATVAERASMSYATPRFLALTLGTFGALALVLAATGIFGAFAFMVSMRRRELGLRLAMGARASHVFGLVLREGLWVVLAGTALGLLVALALGRVLSGFLVGVTPYDSLTLATVVLLVGAAGLLATALPARAAARTDPQQSLRCE